MKKQILVATTIVLTVTALVFAYLYINGTFSPSERGNTTEKSEQDIDYSPPDKEEQEETEKFKEDQSDPNTNNNPAEQDQDNEDVTVTLTRVDVGEDVVTVTGYANSDTAGECKLALTGNGQTKTYSNPTETNPTNENIVNCSTFRVPKEELSTSSEWVAQITYTTGDSSGTSQEWRFNL